MKEKIKEYLMHLEQEEKSKSTREQYERDLLRFFAYAKDLELTKELVIRYKESLAEAYQPSTVNVMLAALNGFFLFWGGAICASNR